jgi:hypothetical protein
MDPAFQFTVADLAEDEAVQLPCAYGVRTFDRDGLAALVGRDARLHLLGLRRELWCRNCGEAPFRGRTVLRVALSRR